MKASWIKTSLCVVGMAAWVPAAVLLFGVSWAVAIGLTMMLLAHEAGHAVQLRREGLAITGLYFVPFLGAAVTSPEMEHASPAIRVRVFLAGPFYGSAVACVPLAIWLITDSASCHVIAFAGFALNAINLIPVLPFDGGHVLKACGRTIFTLGLAVTFAVILYVAIRWGYGWIILGFVVFNALYLVVKWREAWSATNAWRYPVAYCGCFAAFVALTAVAYAPGLLRGW